MDSTSKKSKKKLVILLAVVAVIVIGAAAGILMYNSGIGPADSGNDEPVTVDIPAGSGGAQIIEILDENGLIKNRRFRPNTSNSFVLFNKIVIRDSPASSLRASQTSPVKSFF